MPGGLEQLGLTRLGAMQARPVSGYRTPGE